MRSQATPQAAPAQGAAPTAAERARQLLAAPAAGRRRSYAVAPASSNPHDEPATDPTRWQGFI